LDAVGGFGDWSALGHEEEMKLEVRASAACGRCATPINMSRREFANGQHEWRRPYPSSRSCC
ncbi:MAG TPA: hypothetical protein QF700_07060, partial [Prochlorococcus sp.]|nr:hypothetical protein [Prochlorococcus sp.]